MALGRKEKQASRQMQAVDPIDGQHRCKQYSPVCHHEPADEAYLSESSSTPPFFFSFFRKIPRLDELKCPGWHL